MLYVRDANNQEIAECYTARAAAALTLAFPGSSVHGVRGRKLYQAVTVCELTIDEVVAFIEKARARGRGNLIR